MDESVVLLGQGLDSPWSFGDTTLGLVDRFGRLRVYDTPISENGMTGVATGAAMAGLRPVMMHPRLDFMFLAMDQMVNHASNWHYMFDGRVNVPVVFRGVINRGNEQGAQHSQATHAMYAHVPGLKVVMPTTPADAKGLLTAAIRDPNPVVYIDDRWLYAERGPVPEEPYEIELGKAAIRRSGSDVSVVAISQATQPSLRAAALLADEGISVEVLDPRTIKPLDVETIGRSVARTGRLLVVDSGWRSFGAAAEIITSVAETHWHALKAPPARVSLPDTPAPASTTLEKAFYLNPEKVADSVVRLLR